MVIAKKDKYILGGAASDQTMPSTGKPIRLDINLQTTTTTSIEMSIEGLVYDNASTPKPIQGALVKITDSSFNDISYTITDSLGRYVFNLPLTSATYNILASAKSKKLSPPQTLVITQGENRIVPTITLEDDPSAILGIIAGELDTTAGKEIPGAVVSLYSNATTPPTLSAVTYTNEYGLYVFREVVNGKYSIKFSALGFLSKSAENITVSGTSSIITSNAALSNDPNAANGTISGIIRGANNTPINRGDVILYKIETNGALTPVAFTKTNDQGVYLFINVAPGNYRVLSNEIQPVEVTVAGPDGPNIDNISIERKSFLLPLSVNASDGTLSGGALIDPALPGYVKNLGGSTNGSSKFTIDIPNTGEYQIYFNYMCPDVAKKLVINLDGKKLYETTTPVTAASATSSSYGGQPILTSGKHEIVITGDGVNPSPWVGLFRFVEVVKIYDLSNGELAGGATPASIAGYVNGIGGASDGSTTLTFNVDKPKFTGRYVFYMRYLSDSDKPVRVTVNGVPKDYVATKTNTNNVADFKFLTPYPTIDVKLGVNTIKVHGNGVALSPIIGPIRLWWNSNPQNVFEAENLTLSGSAKANNGIVEGVGGKGDGAITFNYTATEDAYYDLILKYTAPDNNRKLEVITNGISSGEISFTGTGTGSATKNLTLYLYQGQNTIRLQR